MCMVYVPFLVHELYSWITRILCYRGVWVCACTGMCHLRACILGTPIYVAQEKGRSFVKMSTATTGVEQKDHTFKFYLGKLMRCFKTKTKPKTKIKTKLHITSSLASRRLQNIENQSTDFRATFPGLNTASLLLAGICG